MIHFCFEKKRSQLKSSGGNKDYLLTAVKNVFQGNGIPIEIRYISELISYTYASANHQASMVAI
jgi:hypothetical protein